jgi:hypothetical protein
VQFASPSPLANIIPAVGYGVFTSNGNHEAAYTDVKYLNYQTICKESINDKDVLKLLIDKTSSSSDVNKRLLEAIKSYNAGLEMTNWESSYLSFWRVFEILTFGNRTDYNMNDVVLRVSSLLGLQSGVDMGYLKLCSKRRNLLVHRGYFPSEGQAFMLTIKEWSDLCIKSFLHLSAIYTNINELEKYYELAKSSTSDLLERKGVIESILAERKI